MGILNPLSMLGVFSQDTPFPPNIQRIRAFLSSSTNSGAFTITTLKGWTKLDFKFKRTVEGGSWWWVLNMESSSINIFVPSTENTVLAFGYFRWTIYSNKVGKTQHISLWEEDTVWRRKISDQEGIEVIEETPEKNISSNDLYVNKKGVNADYISQGEIFDVVTDIGSLLTCYDTDRGECCYFNTHSGKIEYQHAIIGKGLAPVF